MFYHFGAETVSEFIFLSFRSEARNLVFNKYNALRFLTEFILSIVEGFGTRDPKGYDTFSNYDTAWQAVIQALFKRVPGTRALA
jgi:hypothetical protein